ncbi:MAG: FAD-binding oxidoreductase [Robiginitomaculum sp.]|nr:FAD-binding oxidoreductase [Robiginitomaculum sp.]
MSLVDLPPNFIAKAKAILGDNGWIEDPDQLAPYIREWRDRWVGTTQLLALPSATKTLAELVQHCAQSNVAITPQGGNTGLVGGQIPRGELLVSTQRLTKVRALDKQAMTLTLEAGVTLEQATKTATDHDLLFALDLASGGSATIGGAVSTNAGGMGVLRYGNMRDLVLGLEVVTPAGEIWNGLSELRKDNTGFDLKQLFIGAEGTLGIVTAASLRLFPQPKARVVAWCGVGSVDAALSLLVELRTMSGDQISKFELVSDLALSLVLGVMPAARSPLATQHPWYVLVEFGLSDAIHGPARMTAALDTAMSHRLLDDASIAQTHAQAQSFIALRENISAAQKSQGTVLKHDISLPLASIPEFLEAAATAITATWPGTRICAFGHLGDGNLHYNLLQPTQISADVFAAARDDIAQLVHDLVHQRAGSFSAEHGIGIAKKADMQRYKSVTELRMMQQIKQALDPQNLMNPRLWF